MRRRIREVVVAVPFISAKAAVFGLFIAVPFVYTFVLTFQRGSLLSGLRFTGLDNYRTIVADTLFRDALRNTLLFMVVSTPVTLVVSCAVGLLLAAGFRGMTIHRTLIYLPSLLSVVATGLVWKVMVDPEQGPMHLFMSRVVGVEVPWLTDGTVAVVFLALITAWSTCGFYSIVFMAGFNGIPTELIEAARIDGAGAWQILTRVKLPLIQPVMQVVLVLVTINAVQVFDLVFVMTNGGPGTATYTAMWYVYQNAFNGGSVAYAATMSVVLLLITAVISALFLARRPGVSDDE
jgi:ABC-type sugar transport system permease subunit